MNVLNKLFGIFVFFVLAVLLYGCSKEIVVTQNSSVVINMSENVSVSLNPVLNYTNESVNITVSELNVSLSNVSNETTFNNSNNTLNSSGTPSDSEYDSFRDTDLISESISDFNDLE